MMKELRKAQGALKKAIDRKQQELQPPHDQPLIALPSETISSQELQDIVIEIQESSVINRECDADISLKQCSDSNMGGEDTFKDHQDNDSLVSESPTSSHSCSPAIPILPGLDTYKSVRIQK